MTHAEFYIGLEFWYLGERWRCTDVGSRVVVAISLRPNEVPSGPPYSGFVESTLDETELPGCQLVPATYSRLSKSIYDLEDLLIEHAFDVEPFFEKLHHTRECADDAIESVSLPAFMRHCKALPAEVLAGTENKMTIQRIYFFVELMQPTAPDELISFAWDTYPLASRSVRN